MTISSISDLATNYLLRSHSSRLKGDLANLVEQLSSGKVSARETAASASFQTIAGVQRSIDNLAAYKNAAVEAAGFASATQDSLSSIYSLTQSLATGLVAAGSAGTITEATVLGQEADQDFAFMVNKLNGQYAGRSLFAGASTDTAALADPDEMLAAIRSATSGATTAADVAAAVDAWFSPGGGFDTVGYVGDSQPLAPMQISADRSVSLQTTAADQEIRDILKGVALAALIEDGPLVGNTDEQLALSTLAGETLLAGNDNLVDLQGRIGLVEERIEDAATANASETTAMKTALAEIVTKDAYDGASEVKQLEAQIEILYSLTARTLALRLTDYL